MILYFPAMNKQPFKHVRCSFHEKSSVKKLHQRTLSDGEEIGRGLSGVLSGSGELRRIVSRQNDHLKSKTSLFCIMHL